MMRHRGPRIHLATPVALFVAGILLVLAPSAVAPSSAPVIPSIPGLEKARFRVVVEGTAQAAKDEDWSASSPCLVIINARVEEKTTYQRGRGVVMVFTRLGKGPRAPVIIQRAGRAGDSTLALKVTTTRTASGYATRANPVTGGGVCAPLSEDLTKGPDCGKPDVDTQNVGLLYSRGLLDIRLLGLGALPESDCPHSEIRGGIPALEFGRPTPPKLPQFAIPPGVIFGTKKVIVRATDSGPRKSGPKTVTIGNLVGTISEFGSNRATIRLIRVP